jgi:hypothetical protein
MDGKFDSGATADQEAGAGDDRKVAGNRPERIDATQSEAGPLISLR